MGKGGWKNQTTKNNRKKRGNGEIEKWEEADEGRIKVYE